MRIVGLPELKIARTKPDMKSIKVGGKIIRKGGKKEVETKSGPATVSWAILEGETGSIHLNLWRSQIDVVMVGDMVRLVNAFAKVYRGEIELNIGLDGRIEVLERGA